MIYGEHHGALTSEYSIETINQLFSKLVQMHDIMIFSVEKPWRKEIGEIQEKWTTRDACLIFCIIITRQP